MLMDRKIACCPRQSYAVSSSMSFCSIFYWIRCKEDELDDFEEVDLTYMSSDTLTVQYILVPAINYLQSRVANEANSSL